MRARDRERGCGTRSKKEDFEAVKWRKLGGMRRTASVVLVPWTLCMSEALSFGRIVLLLYRVLYPFVLLRSE